MGRGEASRSLLDIRPTARSWPVHHVSGAAGGGGSGSQTWGAYFLPRPTSQVYGMSSRATQAVEVYFSDVFGVSPATLEAHGALDISVINDLPLFIDPFLLFNSERDDYQALHGEIIRYVRFLRDKAVAAGGTAEVPRGLFMFPEVKQTWLGFSRVGNSGSGLGPDFARALQANLGAVFADFGNERVTKGSHIEKLCLFRSGVGRDNISDFTTNLIKHYLLDYTQAFAKQHVPAELRQVVAVEKAVFNYETESWKPQRYELPFYNGDYVLLTPVDMLAKEDTWINRTDLVRSYPLIVASLPDQQLREHINNYFAKVLPPEPKKNDELEARSRTISKFPELLEHYIRYKEEHGDEAEALNEETVRESKQIYIEHVRELIARLSAGTQFYETKGTTLEETRERVAFLKDVIENKDGYLLFHDAEDRPIRRERDLQLMFRFVWFATTSDVNREVNNGRGPVDVTVSRGRYDKTLVEFKLASNTGLRRNLENQVEIYKKAADAQHALKVIVFFTAAERKKVLSILVELGLANDQDVVLIDARADNKPSASKARTVEFEE